MAADMAVDIISWRTRASSVAVPGTEGSGLAGMAGLPVLAVVCQACRNLRCCSVEAESPRKLRSPPGFTTNRCEAQLPPATVAQSLLKLCRAISSASGLRVSSTAQHRPDSGGSATKAPCTDPAAG